MFVMALLVKTAKTQNPLSKDKKIGGKQTKIFQAI